MAPPCHTFPAQELPSRIQENVLGRRRKLDGGARRIDLSTCELLQMMQYSCEVQNPSERDSPVLCYPVERLFRRCKDRKGSFMVETTAWEARKAEDNHAEIKDSNSTARPFQWAGNWHDPDTASSQNRPSERR